MNLNVDGILHGLYNIGIRIIFLAPEEKKKEIVLFNTMNE